MSSGNSDSDIVRQTVVQLNVCVQVHVASQLQGQHHVSLHHLRDREFTDLGLHLSPQVSDIVGQQLTSWVYTWDPSYRYSFWDLGLNLEAQKTFKSQILVL